MSYRYRDIEAHVEAQRRVIKAAMDLVAVWERDGDATAAEIVGGLTTATELMAAVRALRCLDADRRVRDPSTPGQQEPDAEQEHGQALHPGGQP